MEIYLETPKVSPKGINRLLMTARERDLPLNLSSEAALVWGSTPNPLKVSILGSSDKCGQTVELNYDP